MPTGASCVFANWNPNTEMFTIVANGTGGQVNAGDSVQFPNNAVLPGRRSSRPATSSTATTRTRTGRSWASQIILANNVITNSFPNITTVPVGMPGNPAVYAQPNPPQFFSG